MYGGKKESETIRFRGKRLYINCKDCQVKRLSIYVRDLALTQRAVVFAFINQVNGNALGGLRYFQFLVQFNRSRRINRLQRYGLKLHTMNIIEMRNQLAWIEHPEPAGNPEALHRRLCPDRLLDYSGVSHAYYIFTVSRRTPLRIHGV